MPENFFHLNCLVQGDALDCLFPVQLPSFVSVVNLREVIKDKKQYTFPADQLVLYCTSKQVAYWYNDDAHGLIHALREDEHIKLAPWCPLSTIFDEPLPSGGLHILIELPSASSPVPPATICPDCFVLGDTQDHIFPVKISSSKNIGSLKKAIKDELQHMFCNIDPNQLGLYCVSLSNDSELEDQLEGLDFDKSLEPTLTLANVFAPFPVEGYLHIIV
ncbi:hypothetical protein F5141DRAFT_1066990 [Pisolithus sp. B1]|nr:hypothetical protein F5141DRAFT_1066990 [Pisolithus sp. B1]